MADDQDSRVEKDSMGEVRIPKDALWGASTQRAVENFQFSEFRFPRRFLASLAWIKEAAAAVNKDLGLLEAPMADAIIAAAAEVGQGSHDTQFPLDIFQTGSGTSANMNMNEVVAHLASQRLGGAVHPNDHVNLGQSSNDVIPTAIHVSAARGVAQDLQPALQALAEELHKKAEAWDGIVKSARTHLMDAVPIRLGQEASAWESQVRAAAERLASVKPRLSQLAIGGTAVGTGSGAHPEFGARVAAYLSKRSGLTLRPAGNRFAALASQDAALELSAQLRGAALALLKISTDLRWMNSGPAAGLAEIRLPALQPGSSMMPGKVNPVIPEAVTLIAAEVVGNDAAIAFATQSANFQLHTSLPLIAWKLLESIHLLTGAARALAEKAIPGIEPNAERMAAAVARNPILITALAPTIGYEASARIAHEAMETGESLIDVAARATSIPRDKLEKLMDPRRMTEPGREES